MTWEKLPPLDKGKIHCGCFGCTTAGETATMDMRIAVGFGSSYVTRNGEYFKDCEVDDERITVRDIEDIAAADHDNDWRIVRVGPLHGETFQRHGPSLWVCVESNEGFA